MLLRCHEVLIIVSNGYPSVRGRLPTRYSPVRRCPLGKSTEASFPSFSLDLHVLGTPPAFILSQDQTLNKCYLKNLSIRPNPVMDDAFASRLVISESLLFVFELYRDIRHIVHRLSLIRSWDLISSFHCVDLLTSFYTMKLSWFCWLRLSDFCCPLSRDSLIIIAHHFGLVKHFFHLF